ncbi:MAG: AEC family transporter [Cryobacterium sp.]|nr:AEC family transporter [Oligoflexia bacterium]
MNASFGPFVVIAVGIIAGFLFRRSGRFPAETPRVLNAYVIAIALPAVVLSELPRFLRDLAAHRDRVDAALIFLPLIPWLIFGVAILFFGLLYRAGLIRRDQWGLLALAGGLGNTSFVGIPLLEALLGPDKIPLAVLLDQLGTFLVLAVGGTLWISYFHATSGHSASGAPKSFSVRKFFSDLFHFPPFLALLIAFGVAPLGDFPSMIQSALGRIAATLVPVAMVSVGAQLKPDLKMIRHEGRGLTLGLAYKMVLAPLMIYGIAAGIFHFQGDALNVGVLEAAMAPMITATVLGIEAGFAPNLGALILGIGIPLSLVTVPLLSHLWFHSP